MRFQDRPVGDLLILMLAGTICIAVIGIGVLIAVVEIRDPEVDNSEAGSYLADVINTLIGLMAGFIAGRTEARRHNGVNGYK